MSVPRSLLLAILATASTLGLLMAGAPQVASAAVAPGAARATVDRAAYGTTAAQAASPTAVSPSGCYQRVDYPHKSIHKPGTAAGEVTTKCLLDVPEIAQTAQMWETRWWGWDRIGTRGVNAVWDTWTVSSFAWDWCKNNTVRVTGSGVVIDNDLKHYYASTESIHVKNPCRL